MLLFNAQSPLVVMNFSHVYEKEHFYEHEKIEWINLSYLSGKDCYCDEHAKEQIAEVIEPFPPVGLHFIDSGNFHYVTEFWTDKIKKPFTLVVFDHHSDMQKPLFGDILSCGSWILNVLDHNPYVKNVMLIGISSEQAATIPRTYAKRIIAIGSAAIHKKELWQKAKTQINGFPLYLSIDKDVLAESVLDTNWSQGDMKPNELKNILHTLIAHQKIIGIDICGECEEKIEKLTNIEKNDLFNQKFLSFIKSEEKTDAT